MLERAEVCAIESIPWSSNYTFAARLVAEGYPPFLAVYKPRGMTAHGRKLLARRQTSPTIASAAGQGPGGAIFLAVLAGIAA